MIDGEANPDQQNSTEEPDWIEVYQASRYAVPAGEVWRVFALDGDEAPFADLERSITLITAWNPNSQEQSAEWNAAANDRLRSALEKAGFEFEDSWGASLPGVMPEWRESGFAVYGWTPEEASSWAVEFGQRAVVYLDGESCELLFCQEGWAVACGLRRFADEPRS